MITRLYLDNCFRHYNKTFTFETGLTGIIGPNESGKSLIVEMIRYALFGSKALRGSADDYKKLHVELDFVVRGDSYTVIRKGNRTSLEGAVQAAGTKPVNEAIRRILGYDLTVFDVANACNQGNIEALSNMRPAERKKMVDQTVGLNILDELIKSAGQEGNALKRESEAVKATLVAPVEPQRPEGYRDSSTLKPMVCQLEADFNEFLQLQGYLKKTPDAPAKPEVCPVSEEASVIEEQQENRKVLQRSLANLSNQKRQISPETLGPEECNTLEANLDLWDRWKRKEKLLAQGHHECPACTHQWPVADLGDLADVEEPNIKAEVTRQELALARSLHGNNEKIAELNQAIAELEDALDQTVDRSADLSVRQSYEAQVSIYERNLEAYHRYNQGIVEKQSRFAELQGVEEKLNSLRSELSQAEQFERDHERFKSAQSEYDKNLEVVTELAQKSEDFLKAREAIQALKVSVKSHLLPSLNKVASVLLSRMTGGERYLVEVDQDFEITIDGQPISTLSGSGKAVANLAIRIALGQILTNRVFSIFMADEVDAAMDDERANHTAEALRRLTDTVGQVILVTHKRPETDHMVELKKA